MALFIHSLSELHTLIRCFLFYKIFLDLKKKCSVKFLYALENTVRAVNRDEAVLIRFSSGCEQATLPALVLSSALQTVHTGNAARMANAFFRRDALDLCRVTLCCVDVIAPMKRNARQRWQSERREKQRFTPRPSVTGACGLKWEGANRLASKKKSRNMWPVMPVCGCCKNIHSIWEHAPIHIHFRLRWHPLLYVIRQKRGKKNVSGKWKDKKRHRFTSQRRPNDSQPAFLNHLRPST